MDSILSIVIPAYNEESNISIVLSELVKFCEENNYQLIVVNVGLTDGTKEI